MQCKETIQSRAMYCAVQCCTYAQELAVCEGVLSPYKGKARELHPSTQRLGLPVVSQRM